jgi:hypothetical protein
VRTVWKFQLENHRSLLTMPRGAEILRVGHQNNDLFLWALVDPSEPPVERLFEIVPTGSPTEYRYTEFVGTVVMPIGYVWHVFEAFQP